MEFPSLNVIKFPAESLHTMLLSAFQTEVWQVLPDKDVITSSIVLPTLIAADESNAPKCIPSTKRTRLPVEGQLR
jgi:hypothetical protein